MIEFNPSDVTLLIVEDKPDSQDVLTYFLKPSGYQIHAVNDGVSAMEFINRQLPDIILLDAMLPKLNGFQVCEKLKKNPRTFHIPIIMITALKDLKDKIRSLEAGADDFITKPIDSVELTVRVKSLLKSKFYFEKLQQQNEELVRQKAALEEEDRLKEQLTELIVHDMRSPLNQISINLQMMEMLRKGGQAVESEKYAKRIKIGEHQLLRMILSMLDVSRLERKTYNIQPVAINIPFILQTILKRYQLLQENQSKEIISTVPENLPNVYMDAELFERVLDNLFDFVFRHTNNEGKIFIAATNDPDTEQTTLEITYEGKTVPPEFREKLFDKLAQLELKNADMYRGKGLGLYFCKVALTAQNGNITIDSQYNKGLKFYLNLPTKYVPLKLIK
jgi:DNA-binding response OmpR family regulator